MERRALRWLADEGLVDEEVAERAMDEREDPDLPELSGRFDPFEIARAVSDDLRRLYGAGANGRDSRPALRPKRDSRFRTVDRRVGARLAVLPTEVVNAADRWLVPERAVRATAVVVAEEA